MKSALPEAAALKRDPPGTLAPADSADRAHGATTYCYDFRTRHGYGRLELFDSDYGLHTARIGRLRSRTAPTCPLLTTEPHFSVGASRYSLSRIPSSPPTGFSVQVEGVTRNLEREWTYSDPSRPHKWGTCYSRVVSVSITGSAAAVRSLQVQNWEEPGC